MNLNRIKLLFRLVFRATIVFALAVVCFKPLFAFAQTASAEFLTITKDSFADNKNVELDKLKWKYRAGDDFSWAAIDLDDSGWDALDGSSINRQAAPPSGWNGRGWFRLRFMVDESLADSDFVLEGTHYGASQVYLNGESVAKYGEILENGEIEYDPGYVPLPVRLRAGENVLAVRYSASVLAETDTLRGWWLTNGNVKPGFFLQFDDVADFNTTIRNYSNTASRPFAVFFTGVLAALGLLHLLLFAFYPVERANLFYSIHAFAFAAHLLSIGILVFGHWGTVPMILLNSFNVLMLALLFVALLAFLHVAFNRRLRTIFWLICAAWATSIVLNVALLRSISWLPVLPNAAIFATFTFSIFLLVQALREKRPGAWILMGGVQLFALALGSVLLQQFKVITFPNDYYFFIEFLIVLSIPIAVSIYLARNFARTNRDLNQQLAHVEQLSAKQIEQERQAAEARVEHERTRAENQRRAQELEEARALQLSLLPRKLPQLADLEVAAYMKPASEVGGDYYDFHLSSDGTLTVAIGDATGHGLKAGSVVTATKSLFNAFADSPDIPLIFGQTSKALKKMNLRGLFMAMAILKFKDNRLKISVAGMPPILIYRCAAKQIETVDLRALPLGSVSNLEYKTEELKLAPGDVAVLMSDGFPEMFDPAGEMLGYDKAEQVLSETCSEAAQTIVNRLVETGERWAAGRAQDDDVTFVVLKVRNNPAAAPLPA